MLMMHFQVIGYSGQHWINRQVSFWSRDEINHVGLRFYGTPSGKAVDFYYDVYRGPHLVASAALEKFYTPVKVSNYMTATPAQYQAAGRAAMDYPVGKVLPAYRKLFLGGAAPPTCARMTHDQLAAMNYPVSENFMPGKLLKEFKERY